MQSSRFNNTRYRVVSGSALVQAKADKKKIGSLFLLLYKLYQMFQQENLLGIVIK